MLDYNLDEERAARKQKLAIMTYQLERLNKLAKRWETRQDREGLQRKLRLFGLILSQTAAIERLAMTPIPKFLPGGEHPGGMAIIGDSSVPGLMTALRVPAELLPVHTIRLGGRGAGKMAQLEMLRSFQMVEPPKVNVTFVNEDGSFTLPITATVERFFPPGAELAPIPTSYKMNLKFWSRADALRRIRSVLRKAREALLLRNRTTRP